MSYHLSINVLCQSDFTSQEALLKAYRNEDYVAHYCEIHPLAAPSARWPFAIIARFWQKMANKRRSLLAADRLGSLSHRMLADIGIGACATLESVEDLTEAQRQLTKLRQVNALHAMAAEAARKTLPDRFIPPTYLTDAAVERAAFRLRRSGSKARKLPAGLAAGPSGQTA
jgi:uncharacterized protein YjiS (DUF1127 family)